MGCPVALEVLELQTFPVLCGPALLLAQPYSIHLGPEDRRHLLAAECGPPPWLTAAREARGA